MSLNLAAYDGPLAGFSDTLIARATNRLRRFRAFSETYYTACNQDVAFAQLDPYEHVVRVGCFQDDRIVFRREDVLVELAECPSPEQEEASTIPSEELSPALDHLQDLIASAPKIGLFVNSHGSIFLQEIAEDIVQNLKSIGVQVQLFDENSSISERPPVCIFVAPHEFFNYGRGNEWIKEEVITNAFMFNTEQVQTAWFKSCLPYLLLAKGVADLCYQTAVLLNEASVPTIHITPANQPGFLQLQERDWQHPLIAVLPTKAQTESNDQAPLIERPIDITFFGNESPRREKFLVDTAEFFSDYETIVYYRRAQRGQLKDALQDGVLTRVANHVCRHAKITLNIHRDECGYFEWHRIVRSGMCSNSVVVSEPCLPHPIFKPGVHYFEADQKKIPALIEWLVRTSEGMSAAEKVRSNALYLLRAQFATGQSARKLLQFLLQGSSLHKEEKS